MDPGPTHGTSHFIYSSLSNADNLSQGDLWGLLLVYSYIGAVVVIASKSAYLKRTKMHRKFIHIMIGNIVFFWWVFDHAWAMALLAAAPFIFFCYLLSKEGSRTDEPKSKMEKELKGSILAEASINGHKLGLVFYAISWTLLAFVFFDNLMIASIGIVCMAYGDGMGGLIGKRYGKRKIHRGKTLEGTLSVFIFAMIACTVVFTFYSYLSINGIYGDHQVEAVWVLPISAGIATYVALVELYTPGEYDNLVIPITTVLILAAAGI
jgi:phytol kinase